MSQELCHQSSDAAEPVKRDTEATDDPKPTTLETNEKAIILDGMAVVHEVSGQQLKTCLEIAQAFIGAINSKSQNYTLVHVVFDRYDIDKSLKTFMMFMIFLNHNSIFFKIMHGAKN